MSDKEKLSAIKKYLKKVRKEIDECCNNDCEYNTSTGNGVNSSECSLFLDEVEEEIGNILK